MDINTKLICINTLTDYIELTQVLESGEEEYRILLNSSTVFSLKKIRSLEIEYFNKCDGSGTAFKLFERLLSVPPSKTWGLLGSDLISLIQYWLDAVRKHLISHHIHWWTFLKQLLGFIKVIRQKDLALSNVLVEETSESMLDLATSGKPDLDQCYEILHTFNCFCAESSREIRAGLRKNFEPYFIKLAALLSHCGDAPTQLSCLLALLRWLQPRHDPVTRRDAAASWFPASLYSQDTVEVFLNRAWLNFMQDAREFLNCHNEKSDLVTSVICKQLKINDIVLVTGSEKRTTWLDINVAGSRISVVLEPSQRAPIRALHASETADTLAVPVGVTDIVVLHRESSSVKISIETLEPPVMLSSSPLQVPRRCRLRASIADADLARVDAALRALYRDKYQLMLDIQSSVQCSKPGRRSRKNSKDSTLKSSQSFTKQRITGCGLASRLRNIRSPSSVSTSSLAQLHVKLAALPKYEFTKEPVSVCARPELSIVSERNESEYSNSLESTLQLGFGGCGAKGFLSTRLKSQSDGESAKGRAKINKNVKGSQSEEENKRIRICEEEIHDSILSEHIGSNNSVISATIEHTEKNDPKGDDLIELLVQEALSQSQNEEQAIDSGINTGEKKTQDKTDETETIEGTQFLGCNVIKKPAQNYTVVSKSSSDESNTEVENPVNYVNVRKRNQRRNSIKDVVENTNDNATFDIQAVENFFSQHFAENQMGELIISPTLAKKINETSSEASDEYPLDEDFNMPNEVVPDLEIVECLNSIVDRVCVEFEKCAQYFDKVGPEAEILEMAKNNSVKTTEKDMPLQEVSNLITEPKKKGKAKQTKKTPQKAKPVIKLQFKKKGTKGKGKGKLQLEPVTEMSTIIEEKNESVVNKTPERKTTSPESKSDVLVRRKRKLYSPKDDEKHFQNNDEDVEKPEDANQSDDDAIPLAVIKDKLTTPKSTSASTCYKEIEKERKKLKRTRAQKLKSKPSPPSPKTKKLNDDFEKLRDNIESNENITLIDKKSVKDIVIYNFTSDSEDEDFKQKRIEIQKRTSTTTVGSVNSTMSTRRGRAVNKVNYKETAKDSSSDANTKPFKQRRVRRRKSKASEVKIDRPTNLVDERMREVQPEILNTSFIAETNDKVVKELTPKIKDPEIEKIPEENEADKVIEKKKGKPTKTEKNKKQDYVPLNIIRYDDRTVSPLPGLVIETEVTEVNNADESLTTNLIEKCQNIYKNGPQAYNDTVTTQNMLSDAEKVPSPQMNITEELRKVYDIDDHQLNEELTKPDDQNYNSDVIDDTMNSGYNTDRSISSRKSKKHNLKLKRKKNPASVSHSIKDDKLHKSVNAAKEKTSKKGDSPKPKKRRSSIDEIKTTILEKDNTSNTKESPKGKKRRSSIDEIVCQDIILISSQARTRSGKSTKSQEMEQIDITTISDAKSEKSFPSDGINAHGDVDELPPSPKLLKQQFVSREIQDMDQSVRDFFVELSRKLNDSNDSGKNKLSCRNREETQVGRKRQIDRETERPVYVSPSQTSNTTNKETRFVNHDYDISKWLPSRCDTESENSSQSSRKTPTVSLVKLTPEEVEKWLPSNKSTPSSVKSKRRSPRLKNRKSQISPIEVDKFFGGRKSGAAFNSKFKEPHNWFKSITLRKRNIEPEPNTSKSEEETLRETRNYWSFRPRRTHQSSPNSDYKSKDSSPKRLRSPIATPSAPKKKKLGLTSEPIDLGSRQSSNVDDWLRSATVNSTANTLDASAEFLQNLMEKLDTTLAEIHQNSAKDFLSLFVDAYKQLSELKQARRQMYKETTTTVLSTVTRVLERQFEELDQRAEEGDQKFMTWLKERASAVLRQDSQKKRAMVTLLREDMQAVTEHLLRKGSQE